MRTDIAEFLEAIYSACNRKQRLERDPLAIVVRYREIRDREIAGLVCSTLAFGSVDMIMSACRKALAPLDMHPAITLDRMSDEDLWRFWGNFQYRFCFPKDMIALLRAMREARRAYGSLESLFLHGDAEGGQLTTAVGNFVRALRKLGEAQPPSPDDKHEPPSLAALSPQFPWAGESGIRKNLLPDPLEGSACKRLFLFLRWMVRKDDVDPGGWDAVSPSRLIVPLDVHMARTCRDRLGFLANGSPGAPPTIRDALKATAHFSLYSPHDPVKYDFALTRPGIDPRPGDEIYACL